MLTSSYQPCSPTEASVIAEYIVVAARAGRDVGARDKEQEIEYDADRDGPFLLELIVSPRLDFLGQPEQEIVGIEVGRNALGQRLAPHKLGHLLDSADQLAVIMFERVLPVAPNKCNSKRGRDGKLRTEGHKL